MSSELTSSQPVGDPTDPVQVNPIPTADGSTIEPPLRAADGSTVDSLLLRHRLTATDGLGVDGVAIRSLDLATPQDTALHPIDEPGLAGQFAAVARALAS